MRALSALSLGIALVWSGGVLAAAVPQGSSYDSRMQQVSFNPRNTTVIKASEGYVSTLVFDDDEDVISTRVGMPKGWDVQKEANRVYITVAPIKQTVKAVKSGGDDGETEETVQVFQPTDEGWRTNLFVTTTKRFYSLELRLIDAGKSTKDVAYVVNYLYPQEARMKEQAAQAERQKEFEKQRMQQSIERQFELAKAPRNWAYSMRVAKGSRLITPDFAYDDGRFTYLGFSPVKTFPSVFLEENGKEVSVKPTTEQKGDFKVMVISQTNPRFVLRSGDSVVGVENQGFGKVTVKDGNTVSPNVERVEVQP